MMGMMMLMMKALMEGLLTRSSLEELGGFSKTSLNEATQSRPGASRHPHSNPIYRLMDLPDDFIDLFTG